MHAGSKLFCSLLVAIYTLWSRISCTLLVCRLVNLRAYTVHALHTGTCMFLHTESAIGMFSLRFISMRGLYVVGASCSHSWCVQVVLLDRTYVCTHMYVHTVNAPYVTTYICVHRVDYPFMFRKVPGPEQGLSAHCIALRDTYGYMFGLCVRVSSQFCTPRVVACRLHTRCMLDIARIILCVAFHTSVLHALYHSVCSNRHSPR